MSLTSILAVGLDGAIGVRNELPWRLKSDLKFFKQTTKNQVIIMGRKTYDSLGNCLPHRQNIVLSHTPSLFPKHEGCHHVHGLGEALSLRSNWKAKKAFVIGGAQTYAQFSQFVDRYLITVVKSRFPQADAFFDQDIIGDEANWEQTELNVERLDRPEADEFEFQVFELKHRRPEQMQMARDKLVEDFRKRNHMLKEKKIQRRKPTGTDHDELRLFA